jgi:hypothetical protein
MKFTQLFKNLIFPHLWLNHHIAPGIASALITGGGALLGGLFGGSEDDGEPALSGFAALPPQLQQQLLGAAGQATDQNVPKEFFPDQTFANLTPEQQQGLQGQMDFAGGLQPTIDNIFGSFNQGLNADPSQDPNVIAALDSLQSRSNQNLMQNILPSIRRRAGGVGGEFGTRGVLTSGVAIGDQQQVLADQEGSFLGGQLNSARALQGSLLNNPQAALNTGLFPGQIQQNVGGVFQNQNQQGINEDVNRFNFGQDAPGTALNQLISQLNTIGGTGGASSFSPGVDTGVSTISAALAGGAIGNQIGSSFPDLFSSQPTGQPFQQNSQGFTQNPSNEFLLDFGR